MSVLAGQEAIAKGNANGHAVNGVSNGNGHGPVRRAGWLGLGDKIRFVAGVAYDPWMFPVARLPSPNAVPILSINSETFHWIENLRRLRPLFVADAATTATPADAKTLPTKTKITPHGADLPPFKHPLDQPKEGGFPAPHPLSKYYTLTDTRHHNFSDFPLLVPGLARRMNMTGERDPVGVTDQIGRMTASWLAQTLGGAFATTKGEDVGVIEGLNSITVGA
ncbi:Platelet-activating factor acetylhydrolase [Gonapodya sp. JEL0774]|nr:Platelet-activating factor acetylhydrolase [Gonapodya sp. JEL0774]